MTDVSQDQKGVVAGMLNLSRNLGLITGASVMGAVFALATGAIGTTVQPDTIAAGMRITCAAATVLVMVAIAILVVRRSPAAQPAL